MKKAIVLFLASIGVLFLVISGAYWWSNTPPGRPSDVSANGVFLWAGHLGLPAPKYGIGSNALGNHPKPAIDNHFKTGHREAA